MLPILHLNGYKIANPTVLARIPERELVALLEGYGCGRSSSRRVDEPHDGVHQRVRRRARRGARRDRARSSDAAREGGATERPRWPMLVLRTPKGWTGPREVDGLPVEGTWRSHQVPIADVRENPDHLRDPRGVAAQLPARGALRRRGPARRRARARCRRAGERRMSANPHANGGELLRDLVLPDFRDYAVDGRRARHDARARRRACSATFLRDVIAANPDDLPAVRARTRPRRTGSATSSRRPTAPGTPRSSRRDEHLAPDGRVMEVLSEHLCQGWLEGYLLTGRHGLFNCYEAFIHIVDSMFNQHAKWLKVTRRDPVAPPDRLAQLPAHARTSGARTTTASRTRIPASSTTS